MLRSSVGWCVAILLVGAGVNACSSNSGDEATGKGGTGTVIGGSGGSAGTDNTGGTRTNGGTVGAGGGCADVPLTCVDATHASGCNTDTNMVDTFSCVDESAAVGIISKGCTKDALNGDHCDVSDFKDPACKDGAAAFAYCENATSEQTFNAYVNCFSDYMMAHSVVTCFGKYVTPTQRTADDCAKAEDVCVNGASAGGDGAGGAAPEPMGGAGGAGGAP